MTNTQEQVQQGDIVARLTAFQPTTDWFVGVDSDGCVFDAMEIKHKECFIPATIRCWNLQAASSLVRETAEFVNLYSDGRGLNRWLALIRVFDLLRNRPEVVSASRSPPAKPSPSSSRPERRSAPRACVSTPPSTPARSSRRR